MQVFLNNWAAQLTAEAGPEAAQLFVAPAQAALLAGLGGDNYYIATLVESDGLGNEVAWEIVRVVGANAGTGELTLAEAGRGLDGTTALLWGIGSTISLRVTAATLATLRDSGGVEVSDATPQPLGTAAAGTSPDAARADHVHALPPGVGHEVGDVLLTLRAPSDDWVIPGSTQLQDSYPELFALIGLIGGGPVTVENWGLVVVDTETADHHAIATDGLGVWVMSGGVSGRLLRSTDNGATWSAVSTGASGQIYALTTDRAGVWLACNQAANILYRSTDNGATWASVTLATITPIDVCLAENGVAIAVGSSGNLRRSTDGGITWGTVTSGFGATTIRRIRTDGAGKWVALGNAGKTSYSINDGASFTLTPGTPLASTNMHELETSGAGVWICSSAETGKVARSLDAGATWTVIGQSIPFGAVVHIAADEWVGFDQTLNNRGWRSLDGGVTWAALNDLDVQVMHLAKGDDGTLIGSTNWSQSIAVPVASYPYNPETEFMVPEVTPPAGTSAYIKAA